MKTKKFNNLYFIIAWIALISIFEWYQFDISCDLDKGAHVIQIKCIILNICMIMICNLFIYILLNRLWLTIIMSEIISTGIALVNYYVVQYHGMPFTVTELKNLKTAFHVLKAYNIKLGIIPIVIIIIFIITILFSLYLKTQEKAIKRNRKMLTVLSFTIFICGGYLLFGFYSKNPIKPQKTIGWSWEEAYGKYGYVACIVEDFFAKSNVINKPDDYRITDVESVYNRYLDEDNMHKKVKDYPDIIFIVNESFYDLKNLVDFETDMDYLKNINNMDNLISGYAVAPSQGGGTNSSEYELLTSNSLYLMQSNVAPFNVINLKEATSIVSHLKFLGYNTLGTHTEPGINYNRIVGYNDLGFEIIKFAEEYENLEYYYSRWFETDSSVYKNVEKWYEEMGEAPRFLYLLTIQNHGNWDLNNAECDMVHVTKSEFEKTDSINEYLTSIALSDQAFFELTEYFNGVRRPVIVCMVGDHCPSFANEIIDDSLDVEERNRKLRETPLYIWANFKIDKKEIGSISMPFVMPVLLDIAGVPLSGYYRYLLDISKEVPIITSYGKYYDFNYQCFFNNDGPYSDMVNEYFKVEYSNIEDNIHKNKSFFE